MIGIVLPTYKRNDGTTKSFLEKSILSVKTQIFNDYKLYVIGDDYEDEKEFLEISKKYSDSNISFINLKNNSERNIYNRNTIQLRNSGGINATNYGIRLLLLNENINYICHLDHDDYWENNHLLEINKIIKLNKYDFIVTSAIHPKRGILPKNQIVPYFPISGNLIRSASCINFKKIDLRYRDVYKETGYNKPSDADLWDRINNYMKTNYLHGYHINKVTCIHTGHHID